MAAIREIKPGEDPSAVFAAMSNSANSSDDDYEESDDDLYDDEDDDEDYDVDDEFSIYSKITEGRVSAKVLDKLRQERKATRVMRIPSFCHDDDDNFETECGHCSRYSLILIRVIICRSKWILVAGVFFLLNRKS